MKRFQFLIVLTAFLFTLGGFHLAEAKNYEWKLGTIQSPTALNGQAIAEFVAKVDELTNGQMKIKVGYNSSFGGLKELVPAVAMGSVEMHIEAQNWWDTLDANRKIFTFPYTLTSWNHADKFVRSPIWAEMVKKLSDKGIEMPFPDPKNPILWKRGPTRVICSKRPIFNASDLKGLKLRLYESEMAKRVWKHFGCNITVIAWAEAYLALKQGMVEAITSPLNMTYDMKFHEVAPYITDINEFLQWESMAVNKAKWDGLPVEIQQAMVQAANYAAEWSNKRLYDRVEVDIQKMLDEGAYYIRTSTKSFEEAIKPLAQQMEEEGQWQKGLFEQIQALK
jgi:TRAP-type C4-dicarboxylate transport system substrate-binding protein